jgi:hypothetical protein
MAKVENWVPGDLKAPVKGLGARGTLDPLASDLPHKDPCPALVRLYPRLGYYFGPVVERHQTLLKGILPFVPWRRERVPFPL